VSNELGNWWQIDAGSVVEIAGVVTQGRYDSSQWVTEFMLSYTNADTDTGTFTFIDGGATFSGNGDSHTVVENVLLRPVKARFVRFHPVRFHNDMSMRMGLLINPASSTASSPSTNEYSLSAWIRSSANPAEQGRRTIFSYWQEGSPNAFVVAASGSKGSSLGIHIGGNHFASAETDSRSTLVDGKWHHVCCSWRSGAIEFEEIDPPYIMCSSSGNYGGHKIGEAYARGRLSSTSYSWIAIDNTPGRWYWQINLGSSRDVVGVRVRGRVDANQWVQTLRVRTSQDRNAWICVDECSVFQTGLSDRNTAKDVLFKTSVVAQYVRIYPESCHSHCSMRSAVLAIPQPDPEASSEDTSNLNQGSFCVTDLRSKFFFNVGFSLSSKGVAIVGQHQGSEGGSFDNDGAWLGSIAQLRTYSSALSESQCATEAWSSRSRLRTAISWEEFDLVDPQNELPMKPLTMQNSHNGPGLGDGANYDAVFPSSSQKLQVPWFMSKIAADHDTDPLAISLWLRSDGRVVLENEERTALSIAEKIPRTEDSSDEDAQTSFRLAIKRGRGNTQSNLKIEMMTNAGLKILSDVSSGGVDLGRGTWHHVCFSAASGNDAIATIDGTVRIRAQSTWPNIDLAGATVAVGANLDNSVDQVSAAKAWAGRISSVFIFSVELTEAQCGEVMNSGGYSQRTSSGAKLLPILKWPQDYRPLQTSFTFTSCLQILNSIPTAKSGMYQLRIPGSLQTWTTFCDMATDTDGRRGGWTLFMKAARMSSQKDAIRKGTWNDYAASGIGNPDDAKSDVYWAPLRIWKAYTDSFAKNSFIMLDSEHRFPAEAFTINDIGLTGYQDRYRLSCKNLYNDQSNNFKNACQNDHVRFTTWDRDNDDWGGNNFMDAQPVVGKEIKIVVKDTSNQHSWAAYMVVPVTENDEILSGFESEEGFGHVELSEMKKRAPKCMCNSGGTVGDGTEEAKLACADVIFQSKNPHRTYIVRCISGKCLRYRFMHCTSPQSCWRARSYGRYVGFLNRVGDWDATSNVCKQSDPSMANRYIWDVSPNTDLCINQFAESSEPFDSQSMQSTGPACGNPKVIGSVNGCSTAEGGLCGNQYFHVQVSPGSYNYRPAENPSVTYTYTYPEKVWVTKVLVEQHRNGINCVELIVDGVRLSERCTNHGLMRWDNAFTEHSQDYIEFQGGHQPAPNCAKDSGSGYQGGGWYRGCEKCGFYHNGNMYSWTDCNTNVEWMRGMFREEDVTRKFANDSVTVPIEPSRILGGHAFHPHQYAPPSHSVSARTCKELAASDPSMESGVYTLRDPKHIDKTWETYCLMDRNGGGWTLLGRSSSSDSSTYEKFWMGTWEDYTVKGFGVPHLHDGKKNFWAPLQIWHGLLEEFPKNTVAFSDSNWYQLDSNSPRLLDMQLGDEKSFFEISAKKALDSNVLPAVAIDSHMRFTTHDKDNDVWVYNCAKDNGGFRGGFWYTNCIQTSMVHNNHHIYSWRGNINYHVSWIEIYFRETMSAKTTAIPGSSDLDAKLLLISSQLGTWGLGQAPGAYSLRYESTRAQNSVKGGCNLCGGDFWCAMNQPFLPLEFYDPLNADPTDFARFGREVTKMSVSVFGSFNIDVAGAHQRVDNRAAVQYNGVSVGHVPGVGSMNSWGCGQCFETPPLNLPISSYNYSGINKILISPPENKAWCASRVVYRMCSRPGPPEIHSMSILGGSAMDSNGGSRIHIFGLNFGPGEVPSVTFGPNGEGFEVTNCTLPVSPYTEVECTAPAGIGGPFTWTLRTSTGKTTASSSIHFKTPEITSIAPASGPTKGGTMLTLQGTGIVPKGIVFDLAVEFGGIRKVAYAESGFDEGHDDTVRLLVPEMGDSTSHERNVQLFLIVYDLKGGVLGMTNSSILVFRYESPKLSTVFVSFRGDFESITVQIKGSNLGGPLGIARLCASSVPSIFAETTIVEGYFLPVGDPYFENSTNSTVQDEQYVNGSVIEGTWKSPLPIDEPTDCSSADSEAPTACYGCARLDTILHTHDEIWASLGDGGAIFPASIQVHVGSERSNAVKFEGHSPEIVSNSSTDLASQHFNTDGSGVFRGLLVKHLTLDLNHITVFAGPGGSNRTETILLNDPVLLDNKIYSINVKIPPGAGRDGTLVVFRGGQPSNIVRYHYAPPSLGSVSPSHVPTIGSDLEISGANFGPSWIPIHVYFGSTDHECVVKQRSHHNVVCTLPAGFGSVKKQISLRVAGQDACMPQSNTDIDVEKACSLFSVAYSPPQILKVVQPDVRASQGGFHITIEGTNFGGASIVPLDQVQVVLGPAPDFGDGVRECTLLKDTFSNNQIECTVPPGISLNIPISVTIGDQNSNNLVSGACSDDGFKDEFACITAGRWIHAGCWSVPPMSATLEDVATEKLPQFSDEKSCSSAGNSWRTAACAYQSEDGDNVNIEGDRTLSQELCETNSGIWVSSPPAGSDTHSYGYSPAHARTVHLPKTGFPTYGSLPRGENMSSVVHVSESNHLLITGFNFGTSRISKPVFFLDGIKQTQAAVLYHNHTQILLRVSEGEGRHIPLDLLVQSRSVFSSVHFEPNISYSFAAIDYIELADIKDDGYAPTSGCTVFQKDASRCDLYAKLVVHGSNFGLTTPEVLVSSLAATRVPATIIHFSHDGITARVPPGFGDANIHVISGPPSDRRFVPFNLTLGFEYSPPVITTTTWGPGLAEAIVSGYYDAIGSDLAGRMLAEDNSPTSYDPFRLFIFGRNLGENQPSVNVSIGGAPCPDAQWHEPNMLSKPPGSPYLSCAPGQTVVGQKKLDILILGQAAIYDTENGNIIESRCFKKFYGRTGEFCVKCFEFYNEETEELEGAATCSGRYDSSIGSSADPVARAGFMLMPPPECIIAEEISTGNFSRQACTGMHTKEDITVPADCLPQSQDTSTGRLGLTADALYCQAALSPGPHCHPLRYNGSCSDSACSNDGSIGIDMPGSRQSCPYVLACQPPESCLGNNTCAEGYVMYYERYYNNKCNTGHITLPDGTCFAPRCSLCDPTSHFRLEGECVPCPTVPWLLPVIMLVSAVCGGAFMYLLTKKGVNLAVASVGIDYFQVLSLFSRSKVSWPTELKWIFNSMKWFNFDIDMTGPECAFRELISYEVKWWMKVLLPFVGAFVIFITVMLTQIWYTLFPPLDPKEKRRRKLQRLPNSRKKIRVKKKKKSEGGESRDALKVVASPTLTLKSKGVEDERGKTSNAEKSPNQSMPELVDAPVQKNTLEPDYQATKVIPNGAYHNQNYRGVSPVPVHRGSAMFANGPLAMQHQQPVVYQQQPVVYQQQPVLHQQRPVVHQQRPAVLHQQRPAVLHQQRPAVLHQQPDPHPGAAVNIHSNPWEAPGLAVTHLRRGSLVAGHPNVAPPVSFYSPPVQAPVQGSGHLHQEQNVYSMQQYHSSSAPQHASLNHMPQYMHAHPAQQQQHSFNLNRQQDSGGVMSNHESHQNLNMAAVKDDSVTENYSFKEDAAASTFDPKMNQVEKGRMRPANISDNAREVAYLGTSGGKESLERDVESNDNGQKQDPQPPQRQPQQQSELTQREASQAPKVLEQQAPQQQPQSQLQQQILDQKRLQQQQQQWDEMKLQMEEQKKMHDELMKQQMETHEKQVKKMQESLSKQENKTVHTSAASPLRHNVHPHSSRDGRDGSSSAPAKPPREPVRQLPLSAYDSTKAHVLEKESKVGLATTQMISMLVTLIYFLFVILTRTAVGVFNCEAPTPPDGREYMVDLPLEECWVADGVHRRLVGPGVLLFVVYCFGFPVAVGTVLYKMRNVIRQDQLLRARKRGSSYETNPHFVFRRRCGRLYYQYRPEYFWWILVIIFRKFAICTISILFKDNPTFQLAAALFVMFAMFSMHVRFRPFMDVLESADVVKKLAMQQIRNKLHVIEKLKLFAGAAASSSDAIIQLEDKIEQLEKLMEREDEDIKQHHHPLFNLNTVEAVLLGVCVVVLLAGITFDSVYIIRAKTTKAAITWVTILVVVFSNVYLLGVILREMWISSHKARSKSRFLWKSLRMQRAHVAHKLITSYHGRDNSSRSVLMRRILSRKDGGAANRAHERANMLEGEAGRANDRANRLENDVRERDRELREHKETLGKHKTELNELMKVIATMTKDHSGALDKARNESLAKVSALENQIAQESRQVNDEETELTKLRVQRKIFRQTTNEYAKGVASVSQKHKDATITKIRSRKSMAQMNLTRRLEKRKQLKSKVQGVMSLQMLAHVSHKKSRTSNTKLSQEVFENSVLFDADEHSDKDDPAKVRGIARDRMFDDQPAVNRLLSPEEIESLRHSIGSRVKTPGRLATAFMKLDKNEDGLLSKKEFKVIIRLLAKESNNDTRIVSPRGIDDIWKTIWGDEPIDDSAHLTQDKLVQWVFPTDEESAVDL
jgi:hypothetical protein